MVEPFLFGCFCFFGRGNRFAVIGELQRARNGVFVKLGKVVVVIAAATRIKNMRSRRNCRKVFKQYGWRVLELVLFKFGYIVNRRAARGTKVAILCSEKRSVRANSFKNRTIDALDASLVKPSSPLVTFNVS